MVIKNKCWILFKTKINKSIKVLLFNCTQKSTITVNNIFIYCNKSTCTVFGFFSPPGIILPHYLQTISLNMNVSRLNMYISFVKQSNPWDPAILRLWRKIRNITSVAPASYKQKCISFSYRTEFTVNNVILKCDLYYNVDNVVLQSTDTKVFNKNERKTKWQYKHIQLNWIPFALIPYDHQQLCSEAQYVLELYIGAIGVCRLVYTYISC